ncbi:hypothetical protein P280DRAFT_515459 [Massarina eburnea CBS 473.64]|uniref:Mediator complex subunit 8 n=1 Tax=Massarina eburnea CBS 473.64 TaxID=1395130 RepID=A0A6A6S5Z5_9PLEO|nr:hypothetical protein P280DRAFT_515459 [Massarina eburnea CBS 473.64]
MNQKQNPPAAMAGQPGPAEVAALNSLRQKLLPLVYQLDGMKNEMANPIKPPDWPAIQRATASANSLISSIQSLLNDDPDTTKIFASLHPYPISPYPISDPLLGNIATTHLRKGLEVHEQDWVTSRLAKAASFAVVPPEWEIEPWQPKDPDAEDDEDGADDGEDIAAKKVKRLVGTLNEDQIAELWAQSADIVEEEMANVDPQPGEDDDEEEEDEDEEMEGTDEKPDAGSGKGKEKAVVAQPLMPLEVLHKFMTTGAVMVEPQFQPPA